MAQLDEGRGSPSGLEQGLLKALEQYCIDQRKERRFKIVYRAFKFGIVLFLGCLLLINNTDSGYTSKHGVAHTAVIDLKGVLSEDTFSANADAITEALERAYQQKNVKGIILDMNSPGGSPVQSDLIYSAIMKWRSQNTDKDQQKKIYAVVSDVCASGCYYVAAAADAIYANPLSTIGSIGVVYDGFGFTEGMKKLGVERRVRTAGEHKALLDPFSPLKAEDDVFLQSQLDAVHQIFIDRVKVGRGKRLGNDPNLFTGLFWTGEQSLKLGLIDGFKSKKEVASELIGAQDLISYSPEPNLVREFADRVGVTVTQTFMSALGIGTPNRVQAVQ
jgi:protease-4